MAQRGTWTITVAGQADPLAGYTDAVRGEPIGGGKSIMEITGYGAPDVAFLDLGSRHITRKFIMTREHDANAAACSWYLAEGVADVTLTHMDHTGAETSWLIAGAKIEITVDEPIGVATTTHITITGGAAAIQA